MNERQPIQPYVPPSLSENIPDVTQVQENVLGEPSSVSLGWHIGRVAGVALLVAGGIAGGAAFARNQSGGDKAPAAPAPADMLMDPRADPAETLENLCYSPAVERTFAGDPKVTTDDPADWTKGVLVTVVQPHHPESRGTVIGYHGPDQTVDDASWSFPIAVGELGETPALMRTGHEDYIIAVQNAATEGSEICDTPARVTFKETTVEAAPYDIVEPDF